MPEYMVLLVLSLMTSNKVSNSPLLGVEPNSYSTQVLTTNMCYISLLTISSLRAMNVLPALGSIFTIKKDAEIVVQLEHSQQKILPVLIAETITSLMGNHV